MNVESKYETIVTISEKWPRMVLIDTVRSRSLKGIYMRAD